MFFLAVVAGLIMAYFTFSPKRDVMGVQRRETIAGTYVPVKEGVNVDGDVSPKIGEAISAAREAGLTPVVTSVLRPNDYDSLHSEGGAIDFRSRHLSGFEANRVADEMQEMLGEDFDVIAEFSPQHIHVEYDPE